MQPSDLSEWVKWLDSAKEQLEVIDYLLRSVTKPSKKVGLLNEKPDVIETGGLMERVLLKTKHLVRKEIGDCIERKMAFDTHTNHWVAH